MTDTISFSYRATQVTDFGGELRRFLSRKRFLFHLVIELVDTKLFLVLLFHHFTPGVTSLLSLLTLTVCSLSSSARDLLMLLSQKPVIRLIDAPFPYRFSIFCFTDPWSGLHF